MAQCKLHFGTLFDPGGYAMGAIVAIGLAVIIALPKREPSVPNIVFFALLILIVSMMTEMLAHRSTWLAAITDEHVLFNMGVWTHDFAMFLILGFFLAFFGLAAFGAYNVHAAYLVCAGAGFLTLRGIIRAARRGSDVALSLDEVKVCAILLGNGALSMRIEFLDGRGGFLISGWLWRREIEELKNFARENQRISIDIGGRNFADQFKSMSVGNSYVDISSHEWMLYPSITVLPPVPETISNGA